MIERMKHMKETLMNCVSGQLGDLSSVDAEELGEAMDMIKDLSEAIYYCTITESMEKSEKEKKEQPMMYPVEYRYYPMEYNRYYRDMDRQQGNMYYTEYASGGGNSGGGGRGGNQGGNSGGSRNYDGGMRGYEDGNRQSQGESRNYPIELRDYREGRSPITRKTYMERKMHGGAKEAQMQELEKYMQELTSDITEMIEGASTEEKQILRNKISALATKIV